MFFVSNFEMRNRAQEHLVICICRIKKVVLCVTGTRCYIHLSSKYMGRVEGLCGDYNGQDNDDLSGITTGRLASTKQEFGNQWKTDATCADVDKDNADLADTCEVNYLTSLCNSEDTF